MGHLLADPGCVDLDLECSIILFGQYVATVASHQPGNLPNLSQPKPDPRADAPPCSDEEVSPQKAPQCQSTLETPLSFLMNIDPSLSEIPRGMDDDFILDEKTGARFNRLRAMVPGDGQSSSPTVYMDTGGRRLGYPPSIALKFF